jgi:succinylglutamate desuccinylase
VIKRYTEEDLNRVKTELKELADELSKLKRCEELLRAIKKIIDETTPA